MKKSELRATTPLKKKEILTRKEAGVLLDVHPITLIRWDNQGITKPHKIGGRVYYRYDELRSLFNLKRIRNNAK